MKKNNITGFYETIGPSADEKGQMLEKLLQTKTRKRVNLRPVGLLAAGLALFFILSVPLWGLSWFDFGGADVPGVDPGATEQPGVTVQTSTAPSAGKEVVFIHEETVSLEGIGSLDVASIYQDIAVTLTDAAEMTVRQYDKNGVKPFILNNDGKAISVKHDDKTVSGSITNSQMPRFEIAIPRAFYGDVSLSSTSGDILLHSDANWKTVKFNTSSGDILFGKLWAESVNFKATSGDIVINELMAEGDVNLNCTSGDVVIVKLSAAGNINLETTSGDILVSALAGKSYSVSTTSGDIDIKEAIGEGKAASVSGKVKVNGEILEKERPAQGKDGSSSENKQQKKWGKAILLHEETVSLSGIEKISIDNMYQNINITLTDAEEMTIRQYDPEEIKPLTLSNNGTKISIKADDSWSKTYNSSPSGKECRFEIELPRSYSGDVSINTMSGSVEVKGSVKLNNVKFYTMSGSINIETLEAKDVILSTMSGSTWADKITSETYNISAMSGSVNIKDLTGKGEASVMSGTVTINGKTQEKEWPFNNGGQTFDYVQVFDNGQVNEAVFIHEETVSLEGIDSLTIESFHQIINITFTDASAMTIRHYDQAGMEQFTLKNDSKTIAVKHDDKNTDRMISNLNNPRFEIEIPRSYQGDVSLKSLSGSVSVKEDVNWNKVTVSLISGMIAFENIKAKDVSLKSVSGHVKVKEVEANDVNLKSTSGNVTAEKIISETYSASSTSGNVNIKEAAGEGQATSVTGTVTINGEVQKKR
ncbi:MAG: DUF4097 domain-containing protein [Oscillospiraceae bacterium]|nr:DUF4097 domain-containing protein [Oscillospiraceae bacterium]